MAYKQLKLWFDEALAKLLADKVAQARAHINAKAFVREVADGVGTLELKDRVELIADLFEEHTSGTYPEKAALITTMLGPENPNETGMFTEYYWVMPLAKFVEKYGLNHFEVSIQTIGEITKRNTGEFTIRPYIEKYPEQTVAAMERWAQSENVHLRRLASEGVRIRLPWAQKLHQFVANPQPILRIIEHLKDDASRFVQKSVANNLNDLLKDNYEAAQTTIDRWANNAGKHRAWIIKHALRNQLKAENPWAIAHVETLFPPTKTVK